MDQDGKTFVLILSPILILIGVFFAVAFLKRRIEIYSDRIRYVTSFSTREMLFTQIAGVKTFLGDKGQRFATLLPADASVRKMVLKLDVDRWKELEMWLTTTFTDLDKVTYEKELDEIYHNPALHGTPEEKAAQYKLARKCCNIANGIALALMLWAVIIPKPYKVAILATAAYPLIGIVLSLCFRGIVRFDAGKKSAYATIGIAFLLPSLTLVIRAFLDWNILDWSTVWGPSAEIATGFLAIYLLLAWSAAKSRTAMILLIISSLSYGFGAAICLNGILSTGEFTKYDATVVNKHVDENDQHQEFYLTLSPWGPHKENSDCHVSHQTYLDHQPGDKATVLEKTGRFGIPFYFAF
jgi:hypothetical protein